MFRTLVSLCQYSRLSWHILYPSLRASCAPKAKYASSRSASTLWHGSIEKSLHGQIKNSNGSKTTVRVRQTRRNKKTKTRELAWQSGLTRKFLSHRSTVSLSTTYLKRQMHPHWSVCSPRVGWKNASSWRWRKLMQQKRLRIVIPLKIRSRENYLSDCLASRRKRWNTPSGLSSQEKDSTWTLVNLSLITCRLKFLMTSKRKMSMLKRSGQWAHKTEPRFW